MKLSDNFTLTRRACYLGYIAQAVCINFSPLLFLRFGTEFGIGLSQISLLIAVNFAIQLTIDTLSVRFIDRVSQRGALIAAHVFVAVGVSGLALFPSLFPTPFSGLLAATICCGIGGGLDEVMVSPVVEACPSDDKAGNMSLLHSFYCWGQAGVVLLSSLFFLIFGIEHWRVLACLLAIEPLCGAVLFSMVPLRKFGEDTGETVPLRRLAATPLIWLLFLMMLAGGAAEMAMSQWASSFAEAGLRVDKTLGDLLGTCMFALMMGIARTLYSKFSACLPLVPSLIGSALLCAASYLTVALSPYPILSLLACGVCGFSVGIFWPGVLSVAAAALPRGGVGMFALLALAGDIGCLMGPTVCGKIADLNGGELRPAFLFAAALPVLMILAALGFSLFKRKNDL